MCRGAFLCKAGFTDRAAWDAIHWQFEERNINGMSRLSHTVMQWQYENQERVMAAIDAQVKEEKKA